MISLIEFVLTLADGIVLLLFSACKFIGWDSSTVVCETLAVFSMPLYCVLVTFGTH